MLVCVPFDQQSVVDHFVHVNSHMSVHIFYTSVYDKQTMCHVKKDKRLVLHDNHICIVHVSGVYDNHTSYQIKWEHCLWMTYCAEVTYTLHFKKFEIENWPRHIKIDTTHVEVGANGHVTHTFQLKVMTDKWKRHYWY